VVLEKTPEKLNVLASIVATISSQPEYEHLPRFDIFSDEIGKVALIAPSHKYSLFGSISEQIPWWDPIRDGDHHIIANRRYLDGIPATINSLEQKPTKEIPVYDLERIALTKDYPKSINQEATQICFYGSNSKVAKDYFPGKHLYGFRLNSGEQVLVAGLSKMFTIDQKIHVLANKSGRIDQIGRPIYLAELIKEVIQP
jgi:hypothetical protein